MKKPKAETTFRPSNCGPEVAKTPIMLEPISPAGDDERDDQPVEGDVELVHELVEPLVHEADLDLPVAHLLEHVVHLVRVVGEDRGELQRLAAGAREHALRRVAAEHQAPRVRPRHLEDVEVGVQLDADRGRGSRSPCPA